MFEGFPQCPHWSPEICFSFLSTKIMPSEITINWSKKWLIYSFNTGALCGFTTSWALVLSIADTKICNTVFCLQKFHQPEMETIKQTFIVDIEVLREDVQMAHLGYLGSLLKEITLKQRQEELLAMNQQRGKGQSVLRQEIQRWETFWDRGRMTQILWQDPEGDDLNGEPVDTHI